MFWRRSDSDEAPHCSFCRKPEHEVSDLISSPLNDQIFICSECVAVYNGILDHRGRCEGGQGPSIGPVVTPELPNN